MMMLMKDAIVADLAEASLVGRRLTESKHNQGPL